MTFVLNLPPSVKVKEAKDSEELEEVTKKSRDDYRKLKELEEARKAGTMPAMKDETGKDINPHIPQYIMQAPWYYNAKTPTLRHQNLEDSTQEENKVAPFDYKYDRGAKEVIATRFRKGSCENCGALTHKKKDCVERPRKIGARFTGRDFAPDEFVPESDKKFSYDGKRDRWMGFDTADYNKNMANVFTTIEEAKREIKAARMKRNSKGEQELEEIGKDSDLESSGDEEEKYADSADMPGQKFESKERMTIRNLRIREDTAKYLYNLDTSSAHYDPKTRSMRDDPFKGIPKKELPYAGDNFVRYSGGATEMARQQVFAWDMSNKGLDVHLQADPTKVELMKKEIGERHENLKTNIKESILDRYGGTEYLQVPPKELLLAQSEQYREYSRQGTIVKGEEKVTIRSSYNEDLYINNHTSVWGSFWRDGKWGYKCCSQFVKESYCTGQAGKAALEGADTDLLAGEQQQQQSDDGEEVKSLVQIHKEEQVKRKKKKKRRQKRKDEKKKASSSSSSSSDEDGEDEEKKKKKIKKALKQLDEQEKKGDELLAMDERKRPYNSMYESHVPTQAEEKAWMLKKRRTDDPMANFVGKDGRDV